jgi:hypothetical protein
MLTGTYMIQTLKSKFNLIAIWWNRLSCLLCNSADIGNIPNNRYTAEFAVLIGRDCRCFSVSCPVYNEIRKEHFAKIKGTVITAIGFDSWKRNFNKKDIICQLVIDCQKLVDTGLLPKIDDLIYDIETAPNCT